MTIRTRLTLWFTSVLFVALVAMSLFSYSEFVAEPRTKAAGPGNHAAQGEAEESGVTDVVDILLWCGVPALALALGGGWWMMRRALAPVAALTEAAEQLNEHNLCDRLPVQHNGDELDRLTEVFNAMTERLHRSFLRIREFTLHASHELKTPLTVLRGETEMELQDEDLAPPQRERLESKLDELQRLTKIVDGLTLLTKADAGLITLAFEQVSLADLVRENFADTQVLARAAGLAVALETCEEANVSGDPHRLRQLLLNLADNAAKYNHPGGSIAMSLRRDSAAAEFTIANTGPGIPADALPRVFDRFFRGDPAHSHLVDGCGLGLSIAQWIVSVHNGTIQVRSVPAKLTTVTVRLPLLSK